MHPDAILQGLRRELERLDKNAEDFAERVKAIEAEIEANLGLERPTVRPEDQNTLVDQDAAYLAGLKRELERSEPERHDAIKDEVKRVEKLIADRKESVVGEDDKPSEAEVEQRKQARTGRRAERATAAPGEQRGDEQAESKKSE